ncbi:MAG: BTAD domain-containing putative transcriptional regulator [Acidimicrobiia bacterium]
MVRTLEPARMVEVLGPVRVAGAQLTSPTQLTLLSVLAAAVPETVPFHRLIDAVWDDPPRSAENSLHSHLTRLRRILGGGSIVREGTAYRLASPTDAAQFVALVERAASSDPATRQRDLTEALAMWRGTPFGDCSGHRFLRAPVDALTTTYSRAVRELAGLHLVDGDPLAAVAALQGLVATQPLDEENWALLVEALEASGRRAEALRAVQDAIRALAEVGLDPSGRLRDVEAAALRSGPVSRSGADVPRPAGRLVGRAPLVEILTATVGSPGWATLVGPGGVGKTRLAIEALGRAVGPVVFCDLTEADTADVEVTLARAAGVPLQPPYLDRVATRLAAPGTVLVLDGCEIVAPTVVDLGTRLTRRCPELRVLATSRIPVGVAGERLIEIEPLGGDEAAELLRARVVDAGMEPPGREVLDTLCRSVDRLPLTIEMVAGSLRSLSAEALLGVIDDPLTVLGGPEGDLASSVARSVDLLDDDERTTFERLSMFRGPFVLETASSLLESRGADPAYVGRLRSLRERSLVCAVDTGAGRRLKMLDTIRAVGRARLGQRDDARDVEAQFVETFRARSLQVDAGLRTTDEVRWTAVADAEIVDLRAAHRAAIARGDADAAMTIAASMFHLVYDRLRLDIAEWADEALDEFGDAHPLAARVLAVAALGAMHTDDHDRAWAYAERARTIDGPPVAHVELVVANLGLQSGDLATTASAARNIVASAEAAADPYIIAVGHILHALAIGYGGDRDTALDIAKVQRAISRRVGAPTLLAYADYLEGELLSESDPELALELLRRAHDRAVTSTSSLAEGVALVTITSIRARSADPTGADEEFGSAVRHWRARGDWNHQWATLRNFAEYLTRSGREDVAGVIIGAADAHGSQAYGAEAVRLETARDLIERRLGPRAHERLRATGRSLTRDELLDHALTASGR